MEENTKPVESGVPAENKEINETKTKTRIHFRNPFVKESVVVPVKAKKEKKAKKADAEKPVKTKSGFGKGFAAGFAAGSAFTAGAGFMGQKACRKKTENEKESDELEIEDDILDLDEDIPEVSEDSTEEPKEE